MILDIMMIFYHYQKMNISNDIFVLCGVPDDRPSLSHFHGHPENLVFLLLAL